jgi:UDP-N-acetylmuramate: L-alanyl-gamma-D-glutamyl-meso-diaminopimelate ligase
MTKPNQPWFIRRPMPTRAEVEKVHLIGIAGAGMGAFAGMLQAAGFEVRGSDRNVYPPMSTELTQLGIPWMEGWAPEHLDWGPDLVIVGNVCRRDNPESVAAAERGIPSVSFPQAFSDLFLTDAVPVVIAGTHGKTTTTALTTNVLHGAGLNPGMLVGGVTRNFDSTFLLGGGPGVPFVIEGDEYDTAWFDKGPKFLHYRPQICVINNIEFDHADIYDTIEEIEENFDRLVDILGPGATLLVNVDDARVMARAARAKCTVRTYGFGPEASLRAVDIEPNAAGCAFTFVEDGVVQGRVQSPLAGRHNVWNTLAAIGVARALGRDFEATLPGIRSYAGVKKRQEEKGEARGVLVIDDYGHHPTAIDETLQALRARYPGRRLWAVYEPKSNTARRNVHQDAYAACFDAADFVLFSRPFIKEDKLTADEKLDLDRVVDAIAARGRSARHRPSIEALVELIAAEATSGDVVVFMSSSGFEGIHDKLLARLREGA